MAQFWTRTRVGTDPEPPVTLGCIWRPRGRASGVGLLLDRSEARPQTREEGLPEHLGALPHLGSFCRQLHAQAASVSARLRLDPGAADLGIKEARARAQGL